MEVWCRYGELRLINSEKNSHRQISLANFAVDEFSIYYPLVRRKYRIIAPQALACLHPHINTTYYILPTTTTASYHATTTTTTTTSSLHTWLHMYVHTTYIDTRN